MFVLQYEETDWAFLKRLASRFGSVLVPEVTAASPKVFFGMPVGKLYELERDVSYRRTFHELETGKPGRRAGSYVTYVIESLQYYALGDSIALPIGSGKELAVTRMKDGLLLTRYDLQAEQDIRYARYENDQATGIALTGSVLQVQQDLVQLQLDIDPKQDPAKACWFPVATRYVAEEHSGWYDMPEVGERVELYLPTSREHEAYVMDSRQHRHAQGEPDVKVWRHAQGSGVDISKQELTLSTSGGFSIKLHEGNGITVSSPGDVRIQGGHVKLDAGQELSLTAGSALYLTGGASSMVIDGETDIKAPVVDQEGTVKAPVFVMDLPPVPEPPLMNIKDYEAAQAAAKKGSSNNTNTPTAKITNPADQKQADGLLGTESKLLGVIPMIGAVAGAVVGVAMGAALGGFVGAAVSASLLASAAVPVRSTGTSQAGGGGPKGGLHPLKYLAGLFMQGLISQYEHEKAKDAYYSKWLLGKVFTSARHIASSGGLQELVQNMVIESNAMAQAYQQVPPEVRKRWRASYDRYMAEQPKPKQEEPRSWLAMLGEAQIQQAEAQRAMGKKIAEVGAQTGEEIWSGVKKTGNSFAEIGIDFWNGLEVRANKSLDSPYDFGNWLTVGAFDEVSSRIEGYKTRADIRNDSPYDYVNWLSSGIAGSFKEAFNPDDPLSKEHWMSSFDVVTLILGARGAAPKGGGPTLPKVSAKTPVPKGGGATVNWGQAKTAIQESLEAFQQSASQLSKNKLAYDGPNANYKSSTQKPLEPTKNQIEVRKYYPGSDPKNSASGSTSGKNKNSSGGGTGKVSWNLDDLKNTESFKKGTTSNALNHIFEGEIIKGQAVGFHYEGMPNSKGKVVGNVDPPNEYGVYRANIEVDGILKKAKTTFFPKDWTPQQVIDEINIAFNNKVVYKNNRYRGTASTGITIEFIIKSGKITSAYPLY